MADQNRHLPRSMPLPDGWSAGALAIAVVVLAPVMAVVVIALAPSENIWPQLMATVLPRYLGTTLILMVAVAGMTAVTGTVTAWLVTMYRFPGRGWLDVGLLGHALRRPEVWLSPGLARALWNTLTVAGVAAAVTVAAALFLVYGVRLSGRALPRRLLPLTMLGYAAPGAVLALGFLIPLAALDHRVADGVLALTGHDPGLMLTGTAAALMLAYAVRIFAVAQGATDSAFVRVSPSLPMAAPSLARGAGGSVIGLSADDAGVGRGGAAGGVRRQRQGSARDAAVAAVQLQHACHAGVRTGQPRTPVRGGTGGAVGHGGRAGGGADPGARQARPGVSPLAACAVEGYLGTSASIAQLVEHLICNQGVAGSNPAGGTSYHSKNNNLTANRSTVFAAETDP